MVDDLVKGLPATYTESDAEADTLEIKLYDKEIDVEFSSKIYSRFNNESASKKVVYLQGKVRKFRIN